MKVLIILTSAVLVFAFALGFRNPCAPDKNGDFFKHPTNCSEYIHCEWGIARVRPCPAKLYFHLETKRCEYPKNVTCNAAPSNSTSESQPEVDLESEVEQPPEPEPEEPEQEQEPEQEPEPKPEQEPEQEPESEPAR